MLYDAKTPKDYLNQLEDDWRRATLLDLRAIVMATSPLVEEHIHYKMSGYGRADDYVCHLNAQRGYVSLYVGDILKIDPKGELVASLNVGKGCIRFTKSKSVDNTRIDEFISKAVELWLAGADIKC